MNTTQSSRILGRRAIRALVVLPPLLVATGLVAGSAHAGPGGPGEEREQVTICHATHSSGNPFVEITVDADGLNGHGDHPDDVLVVPAGGCDSLGREPVPAPPLEPGDEEQVPAPPVEPGDEEQVPAPPLEPGDEEQVPAPPVEPEDEEPVPAAPREQVTICHATHSSGNPYVEVTVDADGLNGHGDHPDDVLVVPAEGCDSLGQEPVPAAPLEPEVEGPVPATPLESEDEGPVPATPLESEDEGPVPATPLESEDEGPVPAAPLESEDEEPVPATPLESEDEDEGPVPATPLEPDQDEPQSPPSGSSHHVATVPPSVAVLPDAGAPAWLNTLAGAGTALVLMGSLMVARRRRTS